MKAYRVAHSIVFELCLSLRVYSLSRSCLQSELAHTLISSRDYPQTSNAVIWRIAKHHRSQNYTTNSQQIAHLLANSQQPAPKSRQSILKFTGGHVFIIVILRRSHHHWDDQARQSHKSHPQELFTPTDGI